MQVKIDYRNQQLKVINQEVYDFELYCEKLSVDVLSLLSQLELLYPNPIEVAEDKVYQKIRHRIFDIAGSLKRLPRNIMPESCCCQKPQEEMAMNNK